MWKWCLEASFIRLCRQACRDGKIHFQGNNKSIGELTMALENGVGDIVVDNLSELERLESHGSGTGRHRAHFLPHQAGYRRSHP